MKAFYRSVDSNVSESAINGRIRSLVEQNVLQRVGHGVYSLQGKKTFRPKVDESQYDIYKRLKEAFPYSDLCIWSTSIFSEFMTHQPFQFYTIVEADSDSVSGMFYALQEKGLSVFMAEDAHIIERYGNQQNQTYIIKSLVTQAPVEQVNDIVTTTLEKALADLFCDTELFNAYQGNERNTIFKEAFYKYNIYLSRLLRYADRRGKKERLISYLENLHLTTLNAD